MKNRIVAYRLYRTTLRCLRPFRIASGLQDECRSLILELIEEGGQSAFGEATPIALLTDETLDGCQQVLVELLLPCLLGCSAWALDDVHRKMLALTRAKSARCAVDLALHYLQSRISGVSLPSLLGTERSGFPTNYSIGIEEPGKAAQIAQGILDQGYHRIKLKVGQGKDQDLESIRAVTSVLTPGVKLRLDANCGWSRREAVEILQVLEAESCPIELVEQPTLREDFLGLRYVRERTSYLIAADESVQTLHDARQLLVDDCVDVLNIKLMKCGGLRPALEIVSLAKAFGVGLMVGGMVGESLIGVTAAAALAASKGFDFADLDADILLAESPFLEHHPGEAPLSSRPPERVWGGPQERSWSGQLSEAAILVAEGGL